MRRLFLRLLIPALLALPTACGGESERGTAEEAQALAEKAIARYREAGAETAFAEFNDPKGAFVDRDLYIFVIGPDGKIVAHGADLDRIGMDVRTFKDVDDKPYGEELAAAPPEGMWVDYKRENPLTKEIEPKSSYVKKVDDYVFGCGYYKP